MPAADPYAGIASAPSGSAGGDPYAAFASAPQAAQAAPANGTDAPSAAPKGSGVLQNFGAGFVQGITGLPDMLLGAVSPKGVDVAGTVYGLMERVAGRAAGMAPHAVDQMVRQDATPGQTVGHAANQVIGAATGYNPENVVAATPAERIARNAGAGASAFLLPGAEELAPIEAFGNGAKAAALGTTAGAAAGVAQEVAPEPLKPLAGVVGGTVAALATHGAGMGARAVAGAAGDAAAPFVANVSDAAARGQAARVLASNASDLGATKAALEQPAELVPGSRPTTFQQTGDLGLGSLERTMTTRGAAAVDPETGASVPEPFAARRTDQAVARTSALRDIQPGGDPNDLASSLKARFDELDAQTQAGVNDATSHAQAAATAAGGGGNPEDYGAAVRNAVDDTQAASRTGLAKLYAAVDPNNDLTGNLSATKSAADKIVGAMRTTEKPMAGEEAAIFDAAQNLPQLAPAADLVALKQRVNAAASDEMRNSGSTPTYARLSQLRSAINENLSSTIATKAAADDAAVARGTMAPEDAAGSIVQGWADRFYANRATSARAEAQGSAESFSRVGAPLHSGADGTGYAPGGSASGAPGNPGISPGADQPTFDTGAAGRLGAADTAYAQHAKTFSQGPIGDILSTRGYAGDWKLPNGSVAGKFFHPGPKGFEDMQALYRASDPAQVTPIVADYAATTLRRSAMSDAGVLDPKKYAAWANAHQDALRALPENIRSKFADAATAGQAVADATGSRVQALQDAQAGAVGRVMKLANADDLVSAVSGVLKGKTASTDMLALAQKASAAGPEAVAGLRRAAAMAMERNLIGNSEAGTSGVDQIRADAFQGFMKTAKPALHVLFDADQVKTMENVAADIQRAKRSENVGRIAGNSNTAKDTLAAHKGAGHSVAHAGVTSLLDMFGTVGGYLLGEHVGIPGEVGMAMGGLGTHVAQSFRAAGISKVDELVTTALLHPDVAKELLRKIPADAAGRTVVEHQLARALYRVLPATGAASRSLPQPSQGR